MALKRSSMQRRFSNRWLFLMLAFLVIGIMGQAPAGSAAAEGTAWRPFSFLTDPAYSTGEQVALIMNVVIALCGLGYAFTLINQVYGQETGTSRMAEIAQAVREGADAYLKRQFTTVGVLIVLITIVLMLTKWPWGMSSSSPGYSEHVQIAIGRGIAFLIGSIFSATVGFVGMRLATAGNLRVAAAARYSFGKALQIGYRTGTITGMLTDGLGLLGGSLIFLYFGEKAYEALLGFGFGGTLLALFMRVGGGIYTKAADVGADLVGKIEANIPEDDPRNAATIADNVGDNVGDCAGMAADIFESYEVTIVAAMILGYASFGHKGVIFPLLVRAIGVIGSIISTYTVRTGEAGDVKVAMRAVNRGFWLGSIISVVGFLILGFFYLRFDKVYVVNLAVERGLYQFGKFDKEVGVESPEEMKARHGRETVPYDAVGGAKRLKEEQEYSKMVANAWKSKSVDEKNRIANVEGIYGQATKIVPLTGGLDMRAAWDNFKRDRDPRWLVEGLDMRAAWTCLVGIILAIALNFCTEYWTGTEYSPVKSLAKSCRTGHATNIIQGIAVGYESTVWAVIIIAAAILASVMIYSGTNPIFIAFGVAMCGIGMLTLTGNTISMDVFGPVADNANGIGEMGYNRDSQNQPLKPADEGYMPPEDYKRSRQILADLDAVGNTTKAITKGIAIGSAVIAAVSLFASFIAVMATGSEEGINSLTTADFKTKAAELTVAEPYLFIGLLIGGAVPFLFSSMTIRAVGRAAYLIVQECRKQFKDPDIWENRKKPDYGRVVDICTGTAQKELVGPGLLAIFMPILVGFLLGPVALGGFLAGMIIVGQLLAVFMANSGGAWDNAKKTIEDQPKGPLTGKGSEAHKASVTGDTVGDPLKDTAGPAVNPLIKVMNMVSLLVLPLVIRYSLVGSTSEGDSSTAAAIGVAVVAVAAAAVGWSWWQSKRENEEMRAMDEEFERAAAASVSGAAP
ncbi:MAG TPA: sodium/proton-translocating pyrophosphatase [Gemmataceae bacterium]|jgi:K(+)-stimulated pyrophosphate-energized sodium pump|nr:sodium/proton-translocating pyrophosphatase [Gemmataceae bacterium]